MKMLKKETEQRQAIEMLCTDMLVPQEHLLRQTMRDAEVNVAYRWFLGYIMSQNLPHFATISYAFGHRFTAEVIEGVDTVCRNAPNGYTSIYADVKKGARSEVDTISGSVVETGKRLGIPTPYHEMVVALIHAMENRNRTQGKS